MRKVLLIVARPPDPLAEMLVGLEQGLPDTEVTRIDLNSAPVDYGRLLEAIFESDSVQVV